MQTASSRSIGPTLPDSETCVNAAPATLRQSMLWSEDSPAKTSVSLELVPGWTAREAASGLRCAASFARWDHATLSWRTSQLSFSGDLAEFSETWPTSGSMRSGQASQRAPWVQHTCESDYSLWPTPTASMDGRGFGIPLHERSGRYKKSTVSRVRALVQKHGWRIHPNFTEALMGLPMDFTAITASETPSSPTLPNGSRTASSKRKKGTSHDTPHP